MRLWSLKSPSFLLCLIFLFYYTYTITFAFQTILKSAAISAAYDVDKEDIFDINSIDSVVDEIPVDKAPKDDEVPINKEIVEEETPAVKETTEEIPAWNENTYEYILANRVPNQKVQLLHNVTGEINEDGKLIVDLNYKEKFYSIWNLFPNQPYPDYCELLRLMSAIPSLPFAEGPELPLRPLLNMTWDCVELLRWFGSGNWITAIYANRMAAAAARVDFQWQCTDGQESKMDTLLPWFEVKQPAPAKDNLWPYKGKADASWLCKKFEFQRLDYMIDVITDEMQKMGVTLLGTRGEKKHPSVPENQPALIPDVEVDDVAIHFRCGDFMGGFKRHDLGMIKFTEYKKWISNDTQSIGIVTQPFEKERNRRVDQANVTFCNHTVHHMVDYLQPFYPSAKISIRNTVNDTLPVSFARLIMANQSFTTLSSFGIWPVIGGFGKGYFQQGNGGVNNFTHTLPEYYPDKLFQMTAPKIGVAQLREMSLQSILEWFVTDEEVVEDDDTVEDDDVTVDEEDDDTVEEETPVVKETQVESY
jgi:hypothetical protein